jgi:hypothetical protein
LRKSPIGDFFIYDFESLTIRQKIGILQPDPQKMKSISVSPYAANLSHSIPFLLIFAI